MKAKKVSALRKRGLRCDGSRGAEPLIEAVPQLTDTNPNNQEQLSNLARKTDTMKTYILRQPKPVEPQKTPRWPRPKPAAPVTSAALLGRPEATVKGPVLFIGLDVHNDSIAVSLAPSDTTEVRRYGIIGGEHDDVLKLAKKLAAAHPGT